MTTSSISDVELDALRQRKRRTVVDRASGATHVLLPRVTAGFATTAGFLLASEGATNFSSGRANVAVDEAAVTSSWTDPLEHILQVLCED